MPRRKRVSPSWERIVKAVVDRDGGICHICGHAGAKSADHIIPHTEGGSYEMSNLKAAHAYPHACPVCSEAAKAHGTKKYLIYCNELRGAMSIERARRIIEERTGLSFAEMRDKPEGREW